MPKAILWAAIAGFNLVFAWLVAILFPFFIRSTLYIGGKLGVNYTEPEFNSELIFVIAYLFSLIIEVVVYMQKRFDGHINEINSNITSSVDKSLNDQFTSNMFGFFFGDDGYNGSLKRIAINYFQTVVNEVRSLDKASARVALWLVQEQLKRREGIIGALQSGNPLPFNISFQFDIIRHLSEGAERISFTETLLYDDYSRAWTKGWRDFAKWLKKSNLDVEYTLILDKDEWEKKTNAALDLAEFLKQHNIKFYLVLWGDLQNVEQLSYDQLSNIVGSGDGVSLTTFDDELSMIYPMYHSGYVGGKEFPSGFYVHSRTPKIKNVYDGVTKLRRRISITGRAKNKSIAPLDAN